MAKFPMPDHEGHFWGILVNPRSSGPGDDWASVNWEVVQVIDNNGEGDERWAVFVPGIGPLQWAVDFIWGPEVKLPPELREPRHDQ